MLIPAKLNSIIRILLVNHLEGRATLQIATIAKKANISSAMAKRLVLRLVRSDYARINRGVILTQPIKLLKAWSYSFSIRELDRCEYIAAERPQYVMTRITNAARNTNMMYAFTLLSATEHISPYVAPSDTYLYIDKKDLKSWHSLLRNLNMLPTEKGGNVICLTVDKEYFEGIWRAREVPLVSLPQLYSDLFSYGGMGIEAAEELYKIIKEKIKDV